GNAAGAEESAAGDGGRSALPADVAASARTGGGIAGAAAGEAPLPIRARGSTAAAAVPRRRAVVGEHRRTAKAAAARGAAIGDRRLLACTVSRAATTRAGCSIAQAQAVDALLARQTRRARPTAAGTIPLAPVRG